MRLAIVAALSLVAVRLPAQQQAPDSSRRALSFFVAVQEANRLPAQIDPSRVAALSRRITLDLDIAPLHVALRKISDLSGLQFVYAGDVVNDDRLVHIKERDISVAAALEEVLAGAAVGVVLRSDGVAVLSPAAVGFSQHDTTSTVLGVVSDSAGNPVGSAEVYVLTSGRGARTDESGRYAVGQLLQGPTRLRARMPGWQPVDTAVMLEAHTTVTLNLVFQHRTAALDTIRVVGARECSTRSLDGFDCRRRAGVGVFRDAKEIAALTPIYFADLFDGIPGLKRVPLRLDEGIQATTQWKCIAYLENGHPPFWKNPQQINFLDVVAFEFYDAPKKMPEWYKVYAWRGSEPCSLVVLWLRGAPPVPK
jgi:hypothetical protein